LGHLTRKNCPRNDL